METSNYNAAEDDLKESQRKLEEAQRLAHVGHWERDLKTGVITWSDEIYRILGLERGSPLTEWQHILHPEDQERISIAIEEAQRGLRRYDVEYRIVRPDGEVRFIRSQGDIIRDEQGELCWAFGIAQDITERKRTEEELEVTSKQLRALSARLQSAREEEARRIAREIHDELGVVLTTLNLNVQEIDKMLSEDRPQFPAVRSKVAVLLGLTKTTFDIVRRIASELRPSVLDDLGLVMAIKWQAQQFQDRTGILIHCDSALDEVDLNQEQSTAAFRIFQEALTNILRHAQATTVDVSMVEKGGAFVLTIRDNGRGITADEKFSYLSIGLLGMRERAHLIGGEIDITGIDREGTTVTVWLPLLRSGGHAESGN